MPLSANHEIFLSLLRIGIGHQTSLDPKAAIDWKTIEALAKQQGLLGILLDGLSLAEPTQERVQSQACLSYAERQGGRRSQIADNAEIYLPSANLHALFLMRHLVSHFAAVGITLRQVLDWGFFMEKQGKEVDWEWLLPLQEQYHMKEFFDCINAICVEDLGFETTNFTNHTNGALRSKSLENLKERILNDTLSSEFDGVQPKGLIHRVPFKYRRWKANAWKRELCYAESERSSFWGGVWNHILKPAGI